MYSSCLIKNANEITDDNDVNSQTNGFVNNKDISILESQLIEDQTIKKVFTIK